PRHVVREVELPAATGHLRQALELLVEGLPGSVGRAARRLHDTRRQAGRVGQQGGEEVDGRHLLVLPRPRHLLGAGDHLERGLCETPLVHDLDIRNLSEVMSSLLRTPAQAAAASLNSPTSWLRTAFASPKIMRVFGL